MSAYEVSELLLLRQSARTCDLVFTDDAAKYGLIVGADIAYAYPGKVIDTELTVSPRTIGESRHFDVGHPTAQDDGDSSGRMLTKPVVPVPHKPLPESLLRLMQLESESLRNQSYNAVKHDSPIATSVLDSASKISLRSETEPQQSRLSSSDATGAGVVMAAEAEAEEEKVTTTVMTQTVHSSSPDPPGDAEQQANGTVLDQLNATDLSSPLGTKLASLHSDFGGSVEHDPRNARDFELHISCSSPDGNSESTTSTNSEVLHSSSTFVANPNLPYLGSSCLNALAPPFEMHAQDIHVDDQLFGTTEESQMAFMAYMTKKLSATQNVVEKPNSNQGDHTIRHNDFTKSSQTSLQSDQHPKSRSITSQFTSQPAADQPNYTWRQLSSSHHALSSECLSKQTDTNDKHSEPGESSCPIDIATHHNKMRFPGSTRSQVSTFVSHATHTQVKFVSTDSEDSDCNEQGALMLTRDSQLVETKEMGSPGRSSEMDFEDTFDESSGWGKAPARRVDWDKTTPTGVMAHDPNLNRPATSQSTATWITRPTGIDRPDWDDCKDGIEFTSNRINVWLSGDVEYDETFDTCPSSRSDGQVSVGSVPIEPREAMKRDFGDTAGSRYVGLMRKFDSGGSFFPPQGD